MSPEDISRVMDYPWQPHIEETEKGLFRLTVFPLHDFEIFGSADEVWSEWRDALRSHLTGYIAVGKHIPKPPPIPAGGDGEAETIRYSLDLNKPAVV